jgi:thiol-disulfide isomerase/thioredoxin
MNRPMTHAILVAATSAVLLWASLPARQQPAAGTEFMLVDGRRPTLGALRGRPVLVNFWATSCASCLRDAPALVPLHREFAPHDVELIAVVTDYDPPDRVAAMARRRPLPYAVALDVGGRIAAQFGDVAVTPTLFVLDGSGSVIESLRGPLEPNRLRRTLDGLLPAHPPG